jgi:cysteine synthase A
MFPAPLPAITAGELIETACTALKPVGWTFGPAHTELKLAPDGPRVVEVNPRLAGGMIPELVRLSTGVDLIEQQLLAALGRPLDLAPRTTGHAGIRFLVADRGGVLRGVDGLDVAGTDQIALTVTEGTVVRKAESGYDRLGHVIVTGGSAKDVTRRLDAAIDRVRLRVDDQWESR